MGVQKQSRSRTAAASRAFLFTGASAEGPGAAGAASSGAEAAATAVGRDATGPGNAGLTHVDEVADFKGGFESAVAAVISTRQAAVKCSLWSGTSLSIWRQAF